MKHPPPITGKITSVMKRAYKRIERMIKKMKKVYYFAYGSNMDINRLFKRCPDAEIVGTGYIIGYKLNFRTNSSKKGVANIEVLDNNILTGIIYKISMKDLLILDKCEGHPTTYKRTNIKMYCRKTDKEFMGITYIMQGNRKENLPTDEYLGYLLNGCKQFGLSANYIESVLDDLMKREVEIIEEKEEILIDTEAKKLTQEILGRYNYGYSKKKGWDDDER